MAIMIQTIHHCKKKNNNYLTMAFIEYVLNYTYLSSYPKNRIEL